jgi:hypothetical protein
MPDDVIYAATSEHAATLATLTLKGVVAGAQHLADAQGRRLRELVGEVAQAAVSIERSGGPDADIALTQGTPEWRSLHSAVTREIEGQRADRDQTPASRIIGDFAVQAQARGIVAALDDPDRAKALDLADRNVLEGMREGGDLADLVRHRANGDYSRLTPDQQDDVAEAVAKGTMASPALRHEMMKASEPRQDVAAYDPGRGEDHADTLAMTAAGYMPPLGRQHVERARGLADGTLRPQDDADLAVVAHARAHPGQRDDTALIAQASALAATGVSEAGPVDLAYGIEQHRIAILQAQGRVQDGTSSSDDRHVAVGQTSRASTERQRDLVVAIATAPDVSPLERARLGRHVEDVAAEMPQRVQSIDAARAHAQAASMGR